VTQKELKCLQVDGHQFLISLWNVYSTEAINDVQRNDKGEPIWTLKDVLTFVWLRMKDAVSGLKANLDRGNRCVKI